MKTRNSSLPLVILALLLCGSHSSAQQVSHVQLLGYFDKLPSAPAYPDDVALSSADPESFEAASDLTSLQRSIHQVTQNASTDAEVNTSNAALRKSSPGQAGEEITLKITLDSLESALKELQSVKIEFNANFSRLEALSSKQIDQANTISNKLQQDHPCNGNIDCTLEQLRKRNKGIVDVMKKRLLNEQYLLAVYLTQSRPSFKKIDVLLQSANYGERSMTLDGRNLIRGAQENQVMFLDDILNRIKLERIAISNCVKLSQQGYRRK